MRARKWFHASTLLLFLGNGSELLEKLIFSDPNPLRWTVESKRENTRQHFFFSPQTPGMINHLQKVCLNIWEQKITGTEKNRKTFKPLQREIDACVHMNNAANFTVHWQTLIRNKCVSDWCNKAHSTQSTWGTIEQIRSTTNKLGQSWSFQHSTTWQWFISSNSQSESEIHEMPFKRSSFFWPTCTSH